MSETVRHEPKLFAASGPVTGHEGKYTVAHVGCSCGWNADGNSYKKVGDWHDHMAAAPPVPASGGQEALRESLTKWLHHRLSAAQNQPEEETWPCKDCAYIVENELLPILAAAPAPASQPSQDANENLADYLLRTSPPSWDYKKVLDLAKAVATGASQPELLIGTDGDHHTQDWFDGYEEGRMHFEVTTTASQPDAWTAARHWLLTDDTPNDIALEEGSRRIASLAKLLASRASQPGQTGRVTNLIADWRGDADAIEKSCDSPSETTPWKPCEGCQWHAAGLRQAADDLTAALASPGSQPPEADLEYLRNLAATDISKEIPLTDAQFNWLQERLRKMVREVMGTGESRK